MLAEGQGPERVCVYACVGYKCVQVDGLVGVLVKGSVNPNPLKICSFTSCRAMQMVLFS